MKEIPLNGKHGAGEFALVDDADFDLVAEYSWSKGMRNGYAFAYVPGSKKVTGKSQNVYMHHLIAGVPEGSDQCDHINQNRLDNRRANLRHVTRSTNARNTSRRDGSESQYIGVSRRCDGGWVAQYGGSAFAGKNGVSLTSAKGVGAEAYCAMIRDVAAFVDQGITAPTNFLLPVVFAFIHQFNAAAPAKAV